MRLFVSLLVAEAFVGNLNANSAPMDSTLSTATSVDSLTAGKNDVPVLRLLRTTVTADEDKDNGEQIAAAHVDDDERMFPFKLTSTADSAALTTPLLEGHNSEVALQNSAVIKNGVMNAKDTLFMPKNYQKLIRKAKKTHPNKYIEEVFPKLLKKSDKAELFKVLEEAKVNASMANANASPNDLHNEGVAKLLQDEVLKSWLVDKTDPHQVFEYMGLSSNQKDVLTSPLFSVWTNYIKHFNSRNLTLKTNDIKELLKIYGEEDVFQMIQAAKTKDDVATLATYLQEQLMTYWLEKGFSPSHIIKVVEHGRELDDVLTSPYRPVWTYYLKQFNLIPSEDVTNEAKELTIAYNNEDVFDMLHAAKSKDGNVGKLATKLQEQNMNNWIEQRFNPITVIGIIDFACKEDKMLGPLWDEYLPFFMKYVDEYSKRNSDHKLNAVDDLVRYYHYNGNVLIILRSMRDSDEKSKCQEQLIQKLINEKADPKAMFQDYGGRDTMSQASRDPISPFWIQYLKKYNEANEGSKIDEIELLVEKYDKPFVLQILGKLKTIDGMEELASKLDAQYQARYVAHGVHSSN